MRADAFFHPAAKPHVVNGRTIFVCQDYSLACTINGAPFTAVSDGCSSSPDSDFGSRALVKSALEGFQNRRDFARGWIINRAMDFIPPSGVTPIEALDATLLVAFTEGSKVRTFVTGDGIIVARRRDGTGYRMVHVEYPSGAPLYLSYTLNPGRLTNYINVFGTKRVVHIYDNDVIVDVLVEDTTNVGEMFEPVSYDFDIQEFDVIYLFSDGLKSFHTIVNGVPESVSVADVMSHLLSIKGFAGEFLIRLCLRFFRDNHTRGWFHVDDFGAGAIYTGENP